MKKYLQYFLLISILIFSCTIFYACNWGHNPYYPYIPDSVLESVEEVVTPEMFGAYGDGEHDDTDAVQQCLSKYEDSLSVCVLKNTYKCSNIIRVFPNTYVFLSGKIVANLKDTHGVSLQLFEYNGDNSNYKNKNITITGGGTIDGKGYDESTQRYNSLLRMGHGENIKIENIKFKNAVRYHAMEITSCKNVTINNCRFEGIYAHNSCENKNLENHSVAGPHELIQIEELDSGGSGGMTPYDNTIPEDITISNCYFGRGDGEFYKAIGDHGERKFAYKNIKIINNTFENSIQNLAYDYTSNASNNCIVGFYTKVQGLYISNNKFENCYANAICASGNVEITNNIFKNISLSCISILFDSKIKISNNTFMNFALHNDTSKENYITCINIGQNENKIVVDAQIFNNNFKNNSELTDKIIWFYEFEKSNYSIYDNTYNCNIDTSLINKYSKKS